MRGIQNNKVGGVKFNKKGEPFREQERFAFSRVEPPNFYQGKTTHKFLFEVKSPVRNPKNPCAYYFLELLFLWSHCAGGFSMGRFFVASEIMSDSLNAIFRFSALHSRLCGGSRFYKGIVEVEAFVWVEG